VSGGRV
jgi:hypothetical protein